MNISCENVKSSDGVTAGDLDAGSVFLTKEDYEGSKSKPESYMMIVAPVPDDALLSGFVLAYSLSKGERRLIQSEAKVVVAFTKCIIESFSESTLKK